MAAVLRTASGAAVRESTRAGRVGADGELLYRYPGYRPDADRFDVRPLPNVLVGVLCGVGTSTLVMLALFALVAWVESRR